MVAAAQELAGVLGEPLTDGVAGLPEETLARLTGQIAAAGHRQTAMLDEAIGRLMRGVPLPVRRVVRKALLG